MSYQVAVFRKRIRLIAILFLQKNVVDSIGFFKDYFAHSGADIEYGLRAKRNGANIYVARKASGVCSTNSVIGTSFEQGITILERFKRRHSIKESPHRQKYYFMKENGGNAWMFFWIYSYLKIFLK